MKTYTTALYKAAYGPYDNAMGGDGNPPRRAPTPAGYKPGGDAGAWGQFHDALQTACQAIDQINALDGGRAPMINMQPLSSWKSMLESIAQEAQSLHDYPSR